MYRAVHLDMSGLEPIDEVIVAVGDWVTLARRYDRFEVRLEERITNRTQGWTVTFVSLDDPVRVKAIQIGDSVTRDDQAGDFRGSIDTQWCGLRWMSGRSVPARGPG
jgi:hypothetical protein